MSQQISAAGRLLAILQNAVRLESGKQAHEVWATVFGLRVEQRGLLLQAIASVYALLDQAKAEVEARPELSQHLYLATLTNIQTILDRAQLESQWGQISGQLQGANLIALEFVADQLNRLSDESLIDSAVLADLRERLEAVIAEVLESDLDPTLRSLLLAKLEDARRAVIDYHVTGADGLRRAAESGIGSVIVARGAASKESDKKAFGDFVKVLNDMLDVVSKGKPYVALLKPAVKALLSSPR